MLIRARRRLPAQVTRFITPRQTAATCRLTSLVRAPTVRQTAATSLQHFSATCHATAQSDPGKEKLGPNEYDGAKWKTPPENTCSPAREKTSAASTLQQSKKLMVRSLFIITVFGKSKPHPGKD